jgi:polysaccharide biosynthesis protein VpsQ
MPRQAVFAHSLILFAAAGFFAFIVRLIYLADTGESAQSIFRLLFKISCRVPYGDKIGHFSLFGPLALIVNAALQFRKIWFGRRNIYLGSLLVAAFVLTEELSQHFFPTRSVELLDLLADGAGIALFTWLSGLLDSTIRQRNSAAAVQLPVSP